MGEGFGRAGNGGRKGMCTSFGHVGFRRVVGVDWVVEFGEVLMEGGRFGGFARIEWRWSARLDWQWAFKTLSVCELRVCW